MISELRYQVLEVRLKRRSFLPLSPDRILGYMRIGRQNNKPACYCLTDKDSIKGVFMIVRKTRQLKHCVLLKWKGIDTVAAPPFFDKFMGWFGQRQFAEFIFNDNFPCGSSAQINFIRWIREKFAGIVGQIRAAGNYPQKSAGVQKDIHSSSPWNWASVSSGKSSKNDIGTLNLPFARPMGRGLSLRVASGLISAIGWFRLHNKMVSPCSTSSRYRERWVLAS